jgi:phage gp36-like protein
MDIDITKNKANRIVFPMLDTSNPETYLTGLTVADQGFYNDGSGWLSLTIADTVSEVSSTGMYELDMTAAELNHDLIAIKFTATGAANQQVNIRTTSVASITAGQLPSVVVGDLYSSVDRVLQFNSRIEVTRITSATIISYMQWADNEIDSCLGSTYDVPFASGSVPAIITNLSTELTVIRLLDSFFTQQAPSKNDWRRIRKEELDRMLQQLADGEKVLIDSSGDVISQLTGRFVTSTSAYTPTFNLLDAIEQEVDPDRLDDELEALD